MNGKTRHVDLDPTTLSILRAHRVSQLERPVVALDSRHAYLFGHGDGSSLHPDHVSKRFKKLVRPRGCGRYRSTGCATATPLTSHPRVLRPR